jgi:hypothetical protein
VARPTSRKHHYLPSHYLRGFVDGTGSFCVWDKKADRIFQTNPSAAFFENDLNTVTFPEGQSSDFLEDLYTQMENQSWGALDRIRESTDITPVSLLDKMHLLFFLLFLYWRLPSNAKRAEALSELAFTGTDDFDFFGLTNKAGEVAPKEITEQLKNSEAFQKAFRQVIPFAPFFKKKDWAMRVNDWRFLYAADGKTWHLVGDNPFIIEEDTESTFISSFPRFLFPVSGRILLVCTDKPITKGVPPAFLIEQNNAMIHNAERFVACHSKDFLEAQIKYYGIFTSYGKTDLTIPELFDMLS